MNRYKSMALFYKKRTQAVFEQLALYAFIAISFLATIAEVSAQSIIPIPRPTVSLDAVIAGLARAHDDNICRYFSSTGTRNELDNYTAAYGGQPISFKNIQNQVARVIQGVREARASELTRYRSLLDEAKRSGRNTAILNQLNQMQSSLLSTFMPSGTYGIGCARSDDEYGPFSLLSIQQQNRNHHDNPLLENMILAYGSTSRIQCVPDAPTPDNMDPVAMHYIFPGSFAHNRARNELEIVSQIPYSVCSLRPPNGVNRPLHYCMTYDLLTGEIISGQGDTPETAFDGSLLQEIHSTFSRAGYPEFTAPNLDAFRNWEARESNLRTDLPECARETQPDMNSTPTATEPPTLRPLIEVRIGAWMRRHRRGEGTTCTREGTRRVTERVDASRLLGPVLNLMTARIDAANSRLQELESSPLFQNSIHGRIARGEIGEMSNIPSPFIPNLRQHFRAEVDGLEHFTRCPQGTLFSCHLHSRQVYLDCSCYPATVIQSNAQNSGSFELSSEQIPEESTYHRLTLGAISTDGIRTCTNVRFRLNSFPPPRSVNQIDLTLEDCRSVLQGSSQNAPAQVSDQITVSSPGDYARIHTNLQTYLENYAIEQGNRLHPCGGRRPPSGGGANAGGSAAPAH